MAASLAGVMLTAPCMAFAEQEYTPVPGTTTQITKYLVVDGDSNVPAATFSFTAAPGAAVEPGEGTVEVLPGVGTVTVSNAEFSAGQQTTPGDEGDGITDDSGKKYAQATTTVDLSGASFTEPGVYRYVITEAASADNTGRFTIDEETKRTLDVYVKDQEGTLAVEGYVLYEGEVTDAPKQAADPEAEAPNNGAEAGTKSIGFVNTYNTCDLTFGKTVTGNQGSKDKYFKFTLTINGAGAGTIVNIDNTSGKLIAAPEKSDATKYEAAVMAEANGVTTLTADASGKIEHDFYLSHGNEVKLTGLPLGVTYTITETEEDYTPSATVTGDTDGATASGNTVSDATALTEDTTVAFTNDRTGVLPTGIAMSIVPGIAIVALAVVGIVLLGRKKR